VASTYDYINQYNLNTDEDKKLQEWASSLLSPDIAAAASQSNPNVVPSMIAPANVQEQNVISANADFSPVPKAYGFKNEEYPSQLAESQRKNYEEGIYRLLGEKQKQVQNINTVQDDLIKTKQAYRDQADILQQPVSQWSPSIDYNAEAIKLKNEYGNIQDPQETTFQQIYKAVLPLAFAASGEAGALTAPKSLQQTQAFDLVNTLNLQKQAQAKRDSLSKRIEALAKAKEQDLNQFNSVEKMTIDKAKAAMDAQKPLLTEGGKSLETEIKLDKEISDKINKLYEAGITTPAKTQLTETENEKDRLAAEKRARISAAIQAGRGDLARQDRLAKAAKLSDKQVQQFTDIDNSQSDFENLLGEIQNKKNYVGQFDGRVPDMFTSADQVAFRSALGKMKDAYRHAITGAGASVKEVAMLEQRLPDITDTYDNFVAKAKESVKELERRRKNLATNLEKVGKDVSEFKKPETKPEQIQPDVEAYAKKHGISYDEALVVKQKRTGGK